MLVVDRADVGRTWLDRWDSLVLFTPRRYSGLPGLRFPAGIYEDVPVAMQAHVLATSVDMVGDVVYHWRKREDGGTSITQRRSELPNLQERLSAIRSVRAFLDDRAPELLDDFDALVLEKDTIFLFQALERCAEGAGDPGPLLELVTSASTFLR